jgi:dephospho-CoA kinase
MRNSMPTESSPNSIKSPPSRKRIAKLLGWQVLTNEGLDRAQMLRAIAENPKLKKRLEKVIHPLVFKEIEKKIRSMKGGKLVLDVPLLLDSPLEEECDLIIGVISSEKVQIARLVERGKDPEKSLAMNRHYPKGKLRKQAGILLATDGKKEDLYRALDPISTHTKVFLLSPECGSLSCRPWGRSKSGERRYVCSDCGRTFQLLSQSALAWSKRHLMDYAKALEMMSFNVPLDVVASVVGVHHNTALLWRRKAFATVAEWQRKTRLSGRVWIDEIYTFDYGDPGDHFRKMRRGLSKRKVCVCIAIDCRESLVIFETGHGCPTSAELLRALKGHIEPGKRFHFLRNVSKPFCDDDRLCRCGSG